MVAIVSRLQKGSPLTNAEVDQNFDNLNTAITNHVGTGGSSHSDATQTQSGFMSSTDKAKLDLLPTDANGNIDGGSY